MKAKCVYSKYIQEGRLIFFLCIYLHCPKATNFVSFLAGGQYGQSRAGKMSHLARSGS